MKAVRKRAGVSKEDAPEGIKSKSRMRKKVAVRSSEDDSGCPTSSSSLNESRPSPVQGRKAGRRAGKQRVERAREERDVAAMDVAELLALGETHSMSQAASQMSVDSGASSDSDLSEWEEVAEEQPLKEPVIPKEGVDITLEVSHAVHRKKKKGFDMEGHVKRQLNRVKREVQGLMHKVHVLGWVAHIKFVNTQLNSQTLMGLALSLVTSKNLYPPKHADLGYLERIVKWFRKTIELQDASKVSPQGDLVQDLCLQFEKKCAVDKRNLVLMFIVMLRTLGLKARIVMSFQTVPLRPQTAEPTEPKARTVKQGPGTSTAATSGSQYFAKQEPERAPKGKSAGAKRLKGGESEDEAESRHFRAAKRPRPCKASTPKARRQSSDTDSEFTPQSLGKAAARRAIDRRVLSSEGEQEEGAQGVRGRRQGTDLWAEVFLEAEEKWITADVPRGKIHCVNELHSRATQPVVYVVACNNDSTLKDVTLRYVPSWHGETRRRRVEETWWEQTLGPHRGPSTAQDREEDEDIARQLQDRPLPTAIGEFKDHPLYALKRHLLKFEAIYPAEAPTLGFVRGEPVYGRECVVTLRSRDIWFKEARVVRLGETPYKVVKSRPKYDKMTGEVRRDLPLEVFGIWQTEDYIPPLAVGGRVPRNEYGNVDLFKPCMLPGGTVHLQIPGLIRVAKKLNIDCAPAVVGFEFHSGGSHPIHDGFVVCEEFQEVLLDAWNKDIDESAKRAEEKREKRVWGSWRRLVRGLLIREQLKVRYAFGDDSGEEGPTTSTASTAKGKHKEPAADSAPAGRKGKRK